MKFHQPIKTAAFTSLASAFFLLLASQDVNADELAQAEQATDPAVAQQGKAELTFETKLRKVVTKPETKVVLVEYPFVNNSNEAIEIVEYDAPCTCMGARLRREDGSTSFVFKPGEKGVVIGKLDFENFSGTIEKKIWIRTSQDKKGEPSIVLSTLVTIPTLIGPDKPALNWEIGSEHTPQVLRIKVDSPELIKVIRHDTGFGTDEYFNYSIETITDGKEYQVTVTPKRTDEAKLGVLRFFTDHKLDRYKMVQVFLTISKKKPTETKP